MIIIINIENQNYEISCKRFKSTKFEGTQNVLQGNQNSVDYFKKFIDLKRFMVYTIGGLC